jgi:CRP-like cAMP-binding protein
LGDPAYRQKIHFFRGIILFRDLGRWDLARLVKRMMEKIYAPGDVVFQEGHLGRAFFVLAEGRVEVLRTNPKTGVPEAVAEFGPGDFFGEMVLLDELPRSATCRAVETTRLYVMYKDHFDQLRAQAPRAASLILHALARLLSARLRRERRAFQSPPAAESSLP